jgi:hypothetical protein
MSRIPSSGQGRKAAALRHFASKAVQGAYRAATAPTPPPPPPVGGVGGSGLSAAGSLLDSKVHISPQAPLKAGVWRGVEVYRQDIRVVRSVPILQGKNRPLRGNAAGWTRKVAQRAAWFLRNSALGESAAWFAVLTYPAEYAHDSGVWKRHIDSFGKRIRRARGRGAWFMEFQRRGAPHFNVILSAEVSRDQIRDWWHDVIGTDCQHHAAGKGFYCEPVQSWPKVCGYLVAEVCKPEQKAVPAGYESGVGRWWGKWGVDKVRPVRVLIGSESINAARIARRGVNAQRRAHSVAHAAAFGDGLTTPPPGVCAELDRRMKRAKRRAFRGLPSGPIWTVAESRGDCKGYKPVRDSGKTSRRIWDGAKFVNAVTAYGIGSP